MQVTNAFIRSNLHAHTIKVRVQIFFSAIYWKIIKKGSVFNHIN
jgi:hypothetical protein